MVGAEFAGQVFEDQFLIADVKMTAAYVAVSELSRREKLTMRDAAYAIAIGRVAKACHDRGWV